MNIRRDRKRLKNTSSKTKTMVTSELDFKNSAEPINFSSIKESNISTNCYSTKHKNKFRINSAHPRYFNKLNSTGKYMKNSENDNNKFTSLSSKDWKIFSVREN